MIDKDKDKELLKLAAKAAGDAPSGASYTALLGIRQWNPIEDDGDALRLAVKLHINIESWNIDALVKTNIYIKDCGHGCFQERYTTDPFAATRRAITRAAAEIGRNMK
jgi:hypothetical protein